VPTSPGTEIKVTPEMVVPIMPKATTNQGDFRLAVKKVSVVADLLVRYATIRSRIKYPVRREATSSGFIRESD
jgi:hypothetical protein